MAEKTVLVLIDQLERVYRQLGEQIAALKATASKEPTEGQQAKGLLDWYVSEWGKTYTGQKYVVAGAKDMASFKRLLKDLTAREIAVRARAYLRSRDRLATDSKHAIGVFASTINRYHETKAVSAPAVHAAMSTREYLRGLQGDPNGSK